MHVELFLVPIVFMTIIEFQVMADKNDITLKSSIFEVLKQYPELEVVLMNRFSGFKKLRNPFLRRIFARFTSIYQAAFITGIPAKHLLGKLRKSAGLDPKTEDFSSQSHPKYLTDIPKWMESVTKWTDLDVRPYLERGTSPLQTVLDEVSYLKPTEAIRIVNDYLPVPVLDILRDKGCLVWAELEDGLFYSYVCRKI